LELEDGLLLAHGFSLIFFIVSEDPFCGIDYLGLVDSPKFIEVTDDCDLAIQMRDDPFPGHIAQPQNSIRNSSSLNNLDPAHLRSRITMRATASLSINSLNINDPQRIAWNDTSLVQMESIFEFCLGLVHKRFVDGMALEHDPICLIFNGHLLLPCQGVEMGDIYVSAVHVLFSTGLPYVRAEDSAACCEDYVGAGVETAEGVSPLGVDFSFDFGAWLFVGRLFLEEVQESFANFLYVYYF
jgi:hypothetical protein